MFGPGSRFEIDVTIADIYLVSSFDVNLIIDRTIACHHCLNLM